MLYVDLMATLLLIPTADVTPSPGPIPSGHFPEWYCGTESLHHSPSTEGSQGSITPPPELSKRGEGRRHPRTTPSLLQKIARLAGCDHNSTKIMVECLRALPAEKVMLVSKKMVGRTFQLPSLSACML